LCQGIKFSNIFSVPVFLLIAHTPVHLAVLMWVRVGWCVCYNVTYIAKSCIETVVCCALYFWTENA